MAALSRYELFLTQEALCRGIQLIIIHLDEGAFQEMYTVEHYPTRHIRLRIDEKGVLDAQLALPIRPAEGQGHAHRFRPIADDGEVEVDDVPAGDDVRILLLDAGEEL